MLHSITLMDATGKDGNGISLYQVKVHYCYYYYYYYYYCYYYVNKHYIVCTF